MNTPNQHQFSYSPGESREYSDLFEGAQDLVCTLTAEGQIVSANQAFEKWTGWERTEWIGKRFEGLLHPADVTRFRELIGKANENEQPSPVEVRLRSKTGQETLLECNAYPISKNGSEARVIMFGKDIAQRKRKEEDLFESDAKLRSVLESANDAIVFIGSNLEVLSWNRAAQEIFGHSEEIANRPFDALLAEPYREAYHATIKQLREGGESRLLGKTVEVGGIRADGSEFPLELSLAVWMFRGKPIFAAIIRDITKRKRAEEALQKKNALVQLIQEIAIASNEAVSPEDAMRYALDRICSYTGWPIGHVYLPEEGKTVSTSIWSVKDEECFKNFQSITSGTSLPEESLPGLVIRDKKSIWIKDVTTLPNFSRASAAVKCGLKTAFAMPVLKGTEVAAVLEFFSGASEETDVEMIQGMELVGTQLGRVFDRKKAEDEIKQSRERLRALSAHLQFVREQERIKIAREVHDDLGQVLSALRMELSLLNQNLMESSDTAPRQQILQELGTMSHLVDDTIRSVRRIITELRPEVLDHLDLSSALEWQIQEFRTRTGIKTSFYSTLQNSPLNQEGVTALFRILQETLTNVNRHAQATALQVKLIDSTESIILEVKDNGRGITEEETRKAGSFGILGMRERVLLLGGTLSMIGSPGKGTTVRVEIPLSENR
ncbi:PAS domain S-box protein [bacterium]|nr:PAS domain S-box protein [bacterium]MCI0603151.1 PAS domain S-box protein [bacterium]